MVEQAAVNRPAIGSSPVDGASEYGEMADTTALEAVALNKHAGSSPATRTNRTWSVTYRLHRRGTG